MKLGKGEIKSNCENEDLDVNINANTTKNTNTKMDSLSDEASNLMTTTAPIKVKPNEIKKYNQNSDAQIDDVSLKQLFYDDTPENVTTFITRSPVLEEESFLVAEGVNSYFEKAYKFWEEKGTDELLKSGLIQLHDPKRNEMLGLHSNNNCDDQIQTSINEAIVKGHPRKYQVALFERAKERNIIVNLGTGQGKTLIALLCIRHFALPAYESGKKTLFLVPSIALAVQHTTTLKANLPYTVATACHSGSSSDRARANVQKCNILVATHGAALDILRHYGDYFNLAEVNLIVVDECHYATGNHGYARILDMFYHKLPKDRRPRILGLTASPLVNVRPDTTTERLQEMLSQLEVKLDSELACFSRMGLVSMSDHGKLDMEQAQKKLGLKTGNAEERVVHYFNGIPKVPLPAHDRIGLHESRIKELNQLINLYHHYGPKVTGDYCFTLVREVSRNHYEKETARQFERMLVHLNFLVRFCEKECKVYANNGRSNKLIVLENILHDLVCKDHSKENVGVVFVERRITALALHEYLRKKWDDAEKDHSGKPLLKCDMIVRQSTQVFKYLHPCHKLSLEDQHDSNMEWLHQMKKVRDVLEGLRSKRTNVLIATSVVEEGVDVDACSFVIVLDSIKTSKGYVQMKGRARMKNAKFFVFENSHPDAISPPITLMQAQEVEQRIKSIIEMREPNVSDTFECLSNIIYTGPTVSLEIKALHEGEYRASKGCVEVRSAKSLLNRYAQSIPLDTSSRSSRQALLLHMPIYDGYRLTMPAHLPSDIRIVILPKEFREGCSSKDIQNKLALMACVRLHSLKLLNDRLLPLKRSDMHERLLKLALQKLPDVKDRAPHDGFPELEGEVKQMYCYQIIQRGEIFDEHASFLHVKGNMLAFLTIVPLIEIPKLTFEHSDLCEITCEIGKPKEVFVNSENWQIISKFFSYLMDFRWSKKTGNKAIVYAGNKNLSGVIPPYVIALLNENDDFDWDRMQITIKDFERSEEERKECVHLLSGANLEVPRLWVPIYDPFVPYVCVGSTGLNIAAPFPHNRDCKDYAEYFETKREFKLNDAKSPLYAVQRSWNNPRKMHRSEWLFSNKKRKMNQVEEDITQAGDPLKDGEQAPLYGLPTALLPSIACMEAQIADAGLILLSILVPQILYHIEQCLTTRSFVYHCKERLPILGSYAEKISLSTKLEMLTARSCSMSITYDRFEFLGDAVLKLLQTDALLGSTELQRWVGFLHEGDLSTLRSAMGSNDRLKNAAKSTGIDKFILTKPLGRGQWTPVSLDTCNKDGSNDDESVHDLFAPSNKVCADVMESILGIVYWEFGYEASVEIAEELGLSLPYQIKNNRFSSNSSVSVRQEIIDLSKTFLNIKQFKQPELLMEALTHPSSIYEEVPCYQKLEWIGDAVLCMAIREWAYKTFPNLPVASLVILESMFVCNETLAYLGFSQGLHKIINHRDPSLPRRFEEFQREIGKKGRGLWGT